MTAPKFTRKLSFDEQRALSREDMEAYCDWVTEMGTKLVMGKVEDLQKRLKDDERFLQRDYDRSTGSWQNWETGE